MWRTKVKLTFWNDSEGNNYYLKYFIVPISLLLMLKMKMGMFFKKMSKFERPIELDRNHSPTQARLPSSVTSQIERIITPHLDNCIRQRKRSKIYSFSINWWKYADCRKSYQPWTTYKERFCTLNAGKFHSSQIGGLFGRKRLRWRPINKLGRCHLITAKELEILFMQAKKKCGRYGKYLPS